MTNGKPRNKPMGLIQNQKIEPIQTADTTKIEIAKPVSKNDEKRNRAKNQEANIKVSFQTKNELEILMKLTDNKFGYEMIESLIDFYVENGIDPDKRRAFKTLSSL